jgi:hypothetical protein
MADKAEIKRIVGTFEPEGHVLPRQTAERRSFDAHRALAFAGVDNEFPLRLVDQFHAVAPVAPGRNAELVTMGVDDVAMLRIVAPTSLLRDFYIRNHDDEGDEVSDHYARLDNTLVRAVVNYYVTYTNHFDYIRDSALEWGRKAFERGVWAAGALSASAVAAEVRQAMVAGIETLVYVATQKDGLLYEPAAMPHIVLEDDSHFGGSPAIKTEREVPRDREPWPRLLASFSLHMLEDARQVRASLSGTAPDEKQGGDHEIVFFNDKAPRNPSPSLAAAELGHFVDALAGMCDAIRSSDLSEHLKDLAWGFIRHYGRSGIDADTLERQVALLSDGLSREDPAKVSEWQAREKWTLAASPGEAMTAKLDCLLGRHALAEGHADPASQPAATRP